eukprot:g47827.t1
MELGQGRECLRGRGSETGKINYVWDTRQQHSRRNVRCRATTQGWRLEVRFYWPKGQRGSFKQEPEIYCWSECPVFEIEMTPAGKISKADQGAIKRVLDKQMIPIKQKVQFV